MKYSNRYFTSVLATFFIVGVLYIKNYDLFSVWMMVGIIFSIYAKLKRDEEMLREFINQIVEKIDKNYEENGEE